MKKSYLVQVLEKIAPKIGARFVAEPEWGVAGQIQYKSGKKRYIRYTSLDINTLGASEIAKDKDYAHFFMRELGYPTIEGKTFFSNEWCEAIGSKRDVHAAYRYAQKLTFPVIVKPNSQSQGRSVAKVSNKSDFYRAMRAVFAIDRVALVQRVVTGKDYRIVVLDNEVISAYERIPLSVVGNGRSTIKQLLEQKQQQFKRNGRDTVIRFDDPRVVLKLKEHGFNFNSIIPKQKHIFLLDNANLSTGGDALDVTDSVHQSFRDIAVRLTKDMGLRLCGVDLMIEKDIIQPSKYYVIEINAAPGLDHYVTTGIKQRKIVEDLYLKVLKAMEC